MRDVSVLNVNCEDLSAPYFLRTGDCDLGLRPSSISGPTRRSIRQRQMSSSTHRDAGATAAA